MATETIPQETVFFTIQTIAETQGRDGPQWQISATVPWTKFADQKFWIDGNIPKPTLGQHRGTFIRGALKEGKDGAYRNHYHWRLAVLDPPDPPATTPADAPKRPVQPSNGSAASSGYLDHETATNRRTALMQAREAVNHLCIYGGSLAKDDTGRLTDYMDTVVQLADRFYSWLQGQPANIDSDAANSQDMASSDESEFDQEFPPQGQAPSPAPATPQGTRPKCAACNVFLARGTDGAWVHRLQDGSYHNALGDIV